MVTSAEWVSGVPQQAAQYSITFLQMGRVFGSVREQVLRLEGVKVTAREMSRDDWALDASGSTGTPLFVTGFEDIVNTRGELLGVLRERIMREAASVRGVVLVSRSPRTAFPEAVGSDVVHDARQIFVPAEFAVLDEGSSNELALECVRELGERTVIALADAMWEEDMSPSEVLQGIDRVHAEALRGAGLLDVVEGELRWSGLISYKQLRLAVGITSSESVTVSPAVPDTFTDLWILERLLRNTVRAALISKLGAGWRENCLVDSLRGEVIERAQKDSHPSATRIKDLRDPLEWLSTSELLDIRERLELGGLGLAPALWTKLRVEIVPVRNRVAHMRLLSASEARKVAVWRKIAANNLVIES